jgi:hypothetical protein
MSYTAKVGSEIEYHTIAFDDAVKLIKRKARGRKIYAWVRMAVPFAVQNPAKPDEVLCQDCRSTMVVTLAELLEFFRAACPEHWRSKLTLRVGISKHCIFVG